MRETEDLATCPVCDGALEKSWEGRPPATLNGVAVHTQILVRTCTDCGRAFDGFGDDAYALEPPTRVL